MRKRILIISLVALLLATGTAQAAHYVTGYSSVDEREIRWGGSTTYSTQWNGGISTWNGLSKINIAPDTIWTYEDLKVSDVTRSDVPWTGQYAYYRVGTDTIKLNTHYLSTSTSAQRQKTATHELGHSLGLNDHSISGNIMYAHQTSQTSLGSQDISDYRYLWGY